MARQGVILVAGATGKVGRQVVAQLRDAGAAVRALARDPGRAGLPDGVDVVRGDLTDPDNLPAALDGVESVFLLWPSLSTDGAAAAVDAVKRYARRVVYLSALIHERDIAAVAARALTEDGHAGRTYVRTGPQVVTQEEQVRTI